MRPVSQVGISRRALVAGLATLPALSTTLSSASAPAQAVTPGDPLPSWNQGAAKQAIIDFVHTTVDRSSSNYVASEERIAVFDQDGTLWVEHPIYAQVMYCLDALRRP